MAVNVDNLKRLVIDNTKASDRIVIISGYATPDMVEEIAKIGVQVSFFYGMYKKRGLTKLTYEKLTDIDARYLNLRVHIVRDYHVHTKCYLFYNNNNLQNALVGSANCSFDGLLSGANSEMLVELNETELRNSAYLRRLTKYQHSIEAASVRCGDPSIIVNAPMPSKGRKRVKKGTFPVSSNPYVAYMPLYYWGKTKKGNLAKIVHQKSGLNWGLQSGNSKKGSDYAEAYIAVTGDLVDRHPMLFPFFPISRVTSSGKATRRYDPVRVLWDDGKIMEIVFSGNGVERPTAKNRTSTSPYHKFPKQFTSGADGDGGGAELGKYIRQRMNVSEADIYHEEITLDEKKMPISILSDYQVSIRPCELNNFASSGIKMHRWKE